MRINWKVRLQNKTWLLSMAAAILAFIYQVLGLVGIVPAVSEDQVAQLIGLAVNVLVAIGVVVDPTTEGLQDGEQAMLK